MSEFTDGFLVLKSHRTLTQTALADLERPAIFKDLNALWCALFIDDTNSDHPAQAWILRHSQAVPMLYFYHAEDHGWGYKMYHAGIQKAALDVNYEIASGLMESLAEQLHPGVDVYSGLSAETIETLYKQALTSDEYMQQIAAQYASPGLEHFALFGLMPEKITQLGMILRPERYKGRVEGFSQVEAFQHVLGIEEMSWVSYQYLSGADNTGDLED